MSVNERTRVQLILALEQNVYQLQFGIKKRGVSTSMGGLFCFFYMMSPRQRFYSDVKQGEFSDYL